MPRTGRPRSFDRDDALHRAMEAFWAKGFEGVTLEDLQSTMGGITPPSLYAAFGSKEKLFFEAVELYMRTQEDHMSEALTSGDTTRECIEAILRVAVRAFTQPGKPRGCMVTMNAVSCSAGHERVQEYLRNLRQQRHKLIVQRLRQGVKDGDLPQHADLAGLARFYGIVLDGLSLQARDGASRKELNAAVTDAMYAWPNPKIKK